MSGAALAGAPTLYYNGKEPMPEELDKAHADYLSQTPKFVDDEGLKWQPEESERFRLDVKLLAPEAECVLRLVGVKGRTNYSLTVLFENLPIRKLTYHAKHRMPNGEFVRGLHKHYWDNTNDCRDRNCYVPEDIQPHLSFDKIFSAFLKEENIRCLEPYQGILAG